MKRLLSLIALMLFLGTSVSGISAQEATPDASPVASDSLLSGLGYPVIEYSSDGTTLTGPTELEAGRYLVTFETTSPISDWEMSFYSPPEGMTSDELLTELSAVDTTAEQAPEIYFQIGHGGGVTSPATEAVVELSAGEWVATALFFGEDEGSVAAQQVTVTGELPDYPAIDGAIDVTLADMSITLPETIPAGPHIWQVTNTGALPHFVFIMNAGGELTNEEAVNGVKFFFGMADATPAAEGSAQDPMTWTDVAGSPTITNGVTTFFETDLEPGTYIAFCFLEGPGDLGSHALQGMTQVFTVE